MTITQNEQKAKESEQKAAEAFGQAADSFERSDTDGFASQAASNIMAGKHLLQAKIDRQGGLWEFSALFDLDGNLVPAIRSNNAYGGYVWRVFESDDVDSAIVAWVNESKARNKATFNANMAKKGYYVGSVLAPARADLAGGGKGMAGMFSVYAFPRRTDRGFSRDVTIVDNGK